MGNRTILTMEVLKNYTEDKSRGNVSQMFNDLLSGRKIISKQDGKTFKLMVEEPFSSEREIYHLRIFNTKNSVTEAQNVGN